MAEDLSAPDEGAPGEDAVSDDSNPDSPRDYTDREDRVAFYEWLGGMAAGLGFFVPGLPAPVALYCAYVIRNDKRWTAGLIASIALATIVFWYGVLVFVILP